MRYFKGRNIIIIKVLDILKVIFFSVGLVGIVGQVHYSGMSRLIIPSIILFFLCSIPDIIRNMFKRKKIAITYILFCFILVILLVYSIHIGNSVTLAIRFFTILVLLPVAFFVKSNKMIYYSALTIIALHSLYVIGFALFMMFNSNPKLAVDIREYFRMTGKGDVYTYNGWFYRIQVLGNPLIPFAFFIAYSKLQKSLLRYVLLTILFLGIIFAGNFAFYIATVFFIVMHAVLSFRLIERMIRYKWISGIILIVILVPMVFYVNNTIKLKMESSLPTRVDQYKVLMDDLYQSDKSVIFGRGLGNTVTAETQYRDYTGNYYFELQSVYILNQIGFIPFMLFNILMTALLLIIIRDKLLILVYLSYILYAVTNPYMFDSTNILIIIVITSTHEIIERRNYEKIENHKRGNSNILSSNN